MPEGCTASSPSARPSENREQVRQRYTEIKIYLQKSTRRKTINCSHVELVGVFFSFYLSYLNFYTFPFT